MSKYRSVKVTIDGKIFDSKREANRYLQLKDLEKAGLISNLKTQQKIELIPSQRIDGKCVEREVSYVADFTYIQDGQTIVEDVKGYKTKEYILKRKMMLYLRGIRIKEV